MKYFNGKIHSVAVFDWLLTTSADEWNGLAWWQKLLVRFGLRQRPLGQVEMRMFSE